MRRKIGENFSMSKETINVTHNFILNTIENSINRYKQLTSSHIRLSHEEAKITIKGSFKQALDRFPRCMKYIIRNYKRR